MMGGFARGALWVMLTAWFLFGTVWGALHLLIGRGAAPFRLAGRKTVRLSAFANIVKGGYGP